MCKGVDNVHTFLSFQEMQEISSCVPQVSSCVPLAAAKILNEEICACIVQDCCQLDLIDCKKLASAKLVIKEVIVHGNASLH